MNPSEMTSSGLPSESSFPLMLKASLRGGFIMLIGSLLWGVYLRKGTDPFSNLWLGWVPSAWFVFALGALLGFFLPRWVRGRGLPAAAGAGVFAGIVAGLLVALGVWLCLTHRDLIGLVIHRRSAGYASYGHSVRLQLWNHAFRVLTFVAPLAAAWVTAWTVWINRRSASSSSVVPAQRSDSPQISLRFDRHVLRLVACLAAGFALFAIAALLLTSLVARNVHLDIRGLFAVGPAAAGLVVLGPWLGPVINPGGGATEAWNCSAVALPVLLGGLAPFALRRRPVRPTTAVVAWCGLVIALLFWMAAGALSLGWSLG